MTAVRRLALPEVVLITHARHADQRGWFEVPWTVALMAEAGLTQPFVQDNQAFNARKGTVRGMHFQTAPHPQGKLVRALKGAVYDVAVDIRPGSATFGKWVGVELTAERPESLFVPRGFAHGYCTLTDNAELFYKVDGDYAPGLEGGIAWNDPDLGIDWPLTGEPILSGRDAGLPRLKDLGTVSF
jgi:dTDP-4-dehydrorhamnose 3,5-epimerase